MSKVILGWLGEIMTFTLVFLFSLNYLANTDMISSFPNIIHKPQAAIGNPFEPIKSRLIVSSDATQQAVAHAPVANFLTDKEEFNNAIPFTLRHEGGLVDDKADRGEITKYGISFVYLRHLLAKNHQLLSKFSLNNISQVNGSVIRHMTKQQAIQIYYTQWWEKYHYGLIKKQAIATKAFDYSVNMGAHTAIKLLQIASRNEAGYPSVVVNGKLDHATIQYINGLNATQTKQLLFAFNKAVANHYRNIVKHHPADRKFMLGWLRRANDNRGLIA
jgi:lysozyme family protein